MAEAEGLRPGTLFHERYRVVQSIKSGGMGVVYEVVDERTNGRRALKVMKPTYLENADQRARFTREARMTGAVDSEHLVRIFDAAIEGDTPFLVMELLSGEELGDVLARTGKLTGEVALVYLMQTARALEKTHAAGIVHRDIKPANLFVSRREDGTPCLKILDFGVAKMTSGETAKKTRALGTPLYMAPEQIRGEGSIGPRADLYALGHVAYALLVGEPYWLEDSTAHDTLLPLLKNVMAGATEKASARAMRRKGTALPASFDAWFDRATAADPNARFSSAMAQVEALGALLREHAAPPPAPQRSGQTGMQAAMPQGAPTGMQPAMAQPMAPAQRTGQTGMQPAAPQGASTGMQPVMPQAPYTGQTGMQPAAPQSHYGAPTGMQPGAPQSFGAPQAPYPAGAPPPFAAPPQPPPFGAPLSMGAPMMQAAPARSSSKGGLIAVIAIVAGAAVAGAMLVAVRSSSSQGAGAPGAPLQSSPTAAPVPAAVDYLADPSSALKSFREQVPHGRTGYMVIHHELVTAEIEDPSHKGHFNKYDLTRGTMVNTGPIDEQWHREHLVDLETIPFASIPAMEKDALSRVGSSQATITDVVLKYSFMKNTMVLVVEVQNGNINKGAAFDLTGRFLGFE